MYNSYFAVDKYILSHLQFTVFLLKSQSMTFNRKSLNQHLGAYLIFTPQMGVLIQVGCVLSRELFDFSGCQSNSRKDKKVNEEF